MLTQPQQASPPATAAEPAKRALSVKEFCADYGVSKNTAYRLMADGTLRTVLVRGRRLVPREAAEALLAGA